MYRNLMITLPEECPQDVPMKLILVPNHIEHTKHLTILNQCREPEGFFYRNTVSRPYSHRIMRWQLLESAADVMNARFSQSAFLIGSRFNWGVRLRENQLSSFRWRHALPLALKRLESVLERQAGSLTTLELSMIQPPSARSVSELESALKDKKFPKLRKLTYDGLSHTEPIPQNNPERGGRFRMLRPIFRKAYKTLGELSLSQDHCISQIGKTPLINGRTFDAFLCDLDELYINPTRSNTDSWASVSLNLTKLELGGFKVAKLFNTPSLPTTSPRVRIELSLLRRLVLNECSGLEQLLRDMQARKEEIQLTELGFRIVEDEEAFEDYEQLADTLKAFLLSFKSGLEVLSVLWKGDHAPSTSAIFSALNHHSETLKVYVHAVREEDQDPDYDNTLRFISMPPVGSAWIQLHPVAKVPILSEIAIQLPADLNFRDYACLRLLSQFELRTMHIRNFPRLASGFWRDQGGAVSQVALNMAAKFAEFSALPYYAVEDEDVIGYHEVHHLRELAEIHTAKRDKSLGCVKLKALYSSSAPIREFSKQILLQRAAVDSHFASVMQKVKKRKASAEELKYYGEYVLKVQTALGMIPPTDKPKLRLLIVGDWRYRDQMNLTGPRDWDPNSWCTQKGQDLDSDDGLSDVPDDMEDPMAVDQAFHTYDDQQYRLRYGFKREFDVSLLPIFFKIEWKAERDENKKWRWKAEAMPLDQTTLEGYGALPDVRSLDFAFQN